MADDNGQRARTPVRRIAVAVGLVGLLAAVAVVVWLSGDGGEPAGAPKPGLVAAPPENATITECIVNETGTMLARGSFESTGEEAADYSIAIRFESPPSSAVPALFAIGYALVEDVPAGQSVAFQTSSPTPAPDQPFVCTVDKVFRIVRDDLPGSVS